MKNEDRFTERAKRVFDLAHESAAELGHGYVGSEHILLGIARDGGGAAAKILREAGPVCNLSMPNSFCTRNFLI